MSSGWAFALGTFSTLAFMAWSTELGRFVNFLKHVKLKLKRHRWTIAGVVYTPRPVTRAVMEQVMANQAQVGVQQHPFAFLMQAHDPDEMRAERLRGYATSIETLFETASVLIEDENGNQPSIEDMEAEMTCDQVNEIVQVCL